MSIPLGITIVIPYVGAPRRLESCLRSIAAHDPQRLCCVIVVDNGASEPPPRFEPLGERLSTLRLDHNVGFARAINHASAQVATDLMLVLNDDAVLGASCVTKLLTAVQMNSAFDIFALRVLSGDGLELQSAGLMFSRCCFGNRSHRHFFADVRDCTQVFGPCGAAACFRTPVFRRLGGFNEAFFFMYEDLELAVRANLAGYRCLYVPSATVFHVKGGTIQSNWPLKIRQGFRNSVYTIITCIPARLLRKNMRAIASFYLWLVRTLVREGFAAEVISAFSQLAIAIPQLFARRRRIMSSVTVPLEDFERLLYDGPIEIEGPSGSRRYVQ